MSSGKRYQIQTESILLVIAAELKVIADIMLLF